MVEPEAGAAGPSGVKGVTSVQEPDRLQRAIARRSAEARATVPDAELTADVQMDAALELQAQLQCEMTAIVVQACALALRDVPLANAAYRDGRFELYSRINVGVLMPVQDAYAIPTIFDADRKSPGELSEELRELSQRAQAGDLASPELSGATFTFWNPGELGITSAVPLVVPPQAAAVAAGAIREVPMIRGEEFTPGHLMTMTLACDYRILQGYRAARLLTEIKYRLEEAGA